jgi:hypothetical protein
VTMPLTLAARAIGGYISKPRDLRAGSFCPRAKAKDANKNRDTQIQSLRIVTDSRLAECLSSQLTSIL